MNQNNQLQTNLIHKILKYEDLYTCDMITSIVFTGNFFNLLPSDCMC